ncbi:hypothetical protein CEXT_784681 [Caerostris extrusa]|uniref:Uncharacterized protein n=1 Tax=Caerostris extrusa TaxID=172846 RepID=A0AAV4R157_CAEEX|nr:hypothetical protein CEXT_784681 [Caerostris extrusa]
MFCTSKALTSTFDGRSLSRIYSDFNAGAAQLHGAVEARCRVQFGAGHIAEEIQEFLEVVGRSHGNQGDEYEDSQKFHHFAGGPVHENKRKACLMNNQALFDCCCCSHVTYNILNSLILNQCSYITICS